MSKKLQDNIFARLPNLDLLKFATKQLENMPEAEIICSSFFLYLSTIIGQNIKRQIWEYMNNYAPILLTSTFHNKNINMKIKAKFWSKTISLIDQYSY